MTHRAMLTSHDYRHRLEITVAGPHDISPVDPKPWCWWVRQQINMSLTTNCGPGSTGYTDTREEAITAAYAFAAARVDGEDL